MSSVAPLLKQLRLTAVPSISLRKTAEKLGVGPSTYAVYENANLYKKPHLPIDLPVSWRQFLRIMALSLRRL
jgi:hypothetical protein